MVVVSTITMTHAIAASNENRNFGFELHPSRVICSSYPGHNESVARAARQSSEVRQGLFFARLEKSRLGPRNRYIDERLGGDNRPTFQNSLVRGDPDLARGSEVFYYSSAGFLTVWQVSPARNNGLTSSGGRLELIWTEHRASRSQPGLKRHTCSGDRNSSNPALERPMVNSTKPGQ